MKIYEIGTGYTPIPAQVAAATESVVEELTRAFLAMGQDAEILDISAHDRAAHDLPITEVPVPSAVIRSDVRLGVMHKVKRVVYSLALAGTLKKILKKTEERIVLHFHNQYNMFFFLKLVPQALRAKALLVYTNHNGVWSLPWEEAEESIRKRYFQESEALKQADLIFVMNQRMKENAVAHLGIPAERIVLINNGVNANVYTPLEADERKRIKKELSLEGKRVILQVGSVNENKGQGRSLKLLAPILKERKDWMFAYAGGIVSEDYHREVQRLAQELGVADQVRYLGTFRPGEEMNRIYNMADMTIVASNYEAFPLVSVEAMAAGVPVILHTEIPIDFGEGCIRLGQNAPEEALRRMVEEDACRALGEQARKNAERTFTWRCIGQNCLNAMQNAI